jgi:hypothetical protein
MCLWNIFSLYLLADCQPAESEIDIWEKVNEVVKKSDEIIEELRSYNGASDYIRGVRNNMYFYWGRDSHVSQQPEYFMKQYLVKIMV